METKVKLPRIIGLPFRCRFEDGTVVFPQQIVIIKTFKCDNHYENVIFDISKFEKYPVIGYFDAKDNEYREVSFQGGHFESIAPCQDRDGNDLYLNDVGILDYDEEDDDNPIKAEATVVIIGDSWKLDVNNGNQFHCYKDLDYYSQYFTLIK